MPSSDSGRISVCQVTLVIMSNRIGDIRDPALFQRLVRILYAAEYGHEFQVVDDSSGDRGNDGYDPHLGRLLAIYCPEKEANQKNLLKKGRTDIAKAVRLKDDPAYHFDKWFFITPCALPEKVQAKLHANAAAGGLEATFLSADHLEPMYLKHDHLHDLFTELAYPQVQKQLRSTQAKLDTLLARSGPPAPSAPPLAVQVLVHSALAGQVAELAEVVSTGALREIDEMRQNWQQGKHDTVWNWLRQFEDTPALLRVLSPPIAAEVLRFHAGLVLEDAQNTDRAAALLDQARQMQPEGNDVRLRTVLALRRGSTGEALTVLDNSPSPQPAEHNLRAGILLERGDPQAALTILAIAASQEIDDADIASVERARTEMHRLGAVAHFMLHNLDAAQSEIAIASALSPMWESVRYLDGVIRYFRGLSPVAHPTSVPLWPQPVEPALVMRDKASHQSFRTALGLFDRMLELIQDKGSRRRVEAWRLACLANLSGEETETARYAAEILARDLEHEYAVVWVVQRGIPVDVSPNLEALSERARQTGSLDDFVVVTSVYLATEQPKKAVALLDEVRAAFEEGDETVVWRYWRAQAALGVGDFSLAETLATDLPPDPRRALKLTTLQLKVARGGDSAELLSFLEECARETGNPRYLLQACFHHARNGSWAYVAERASTLLGAIDTGETRRLAAFAYLHTLQLDRCMEVATSALEQVSDKALSAELRRILAQALVGLGNIPSAISELTVLTATSPDTADLLELARLHALQGDLHRVAVLATDLRDRADLSPVSALGLAEIVIHVDRDLARALWRLAVGKHLPDDAVGRALSMGMQLGLDPETADLTAQMAALASAGKGGIQTFAIAELVAMADEWRIHHAEVLSLYAKGDAPIHALSAALNAPMTGLFHPSDILRGDLLDRFALRVRYGGRSLPSGDLGIGPGRMCLDTTALLLSEQIGILDVVEKTFGPLYLPFGIMQFFYEEREKLGPHQPSRIETARRILDAERRGLVTQRQADLPALTPQQTNAAGSWSEWLALLELARQEDAYVLDFALEAESEHGRPIAATNEDQLQRLVTPRQIVEALASHGRLTAADRERTLQRLGHTASLSAVPGTREAPPPWGATLYALDGALDALADSGLLAQMADNFKLVVEPKAQDERRATVNASADLERTREWLDALMRRVSDGLTHGVYRQLPHPIEKRPQDTPTPIGLLGQLVSPHQDLIDAVWVDDRFINQFSFSARARIVDILEVLAALEARGAIDTQRRIDLVLRLRAANTRFIPPTADEFVQHVNAATLSGGRLLETTALAMLRQSIAVTLADRSSLRIPNALATAPSNLGELPYLLTVYHAVVDAVTALWRGARDQAGDPESIARDIANRARWIVDNVMIDLGLLRAALLHPDRPPDLQVSAAGLAALVGYAVTLLDQAPNCADEPQDEWTRRYLHWLWNSVIEPRCALDPALRAAVVDLVRKQLIERPTERGDNPVVVTVARLLAGRQFDAMPAELQAELSKDKELLDFVGREISDVFGDGQHSFPADSFVGAVAGAFRGESGRIKDVAGHEVVVEPAPPPGVFLLREPGVAVPAVVHDPAYCVLADGIETRLTAVSRLSQELDLAPDAEEQLRIALASEPDARTRLRMFEQRRSGSLRRRYRLLERELRATGKFDPEAIAAPSIPQVLTYLRLPNLSGGQALADALDQAAKSLIEQVGFEEAFQRLNGLPVAMPRAILAHLSNMGNEARRKLIKRALRRPTSPVGFLHALRVLADFAATDSASARLLRRLARRLGTERWDDEVEVFKALLSNGLDGLESASQGDPESPALLVSAWVHAHRTTMAFLAAGADPAKLGELVSRLNTRKWIHLFTQNRQARNDVSHPRRINAKRLALAAAAYALDAAPEEIWTEELGSHLLTGLTMATGERRLPVRELLLDTTALTNDLDSFLAFDHAGTTSAFSRLQVAVFAEFPNKNHVASEAVAKLLKDNTDAGSWLTLFLVTGDVPLDEETSSQAIALIRTLNLGKVVPAVGEYAPIPIMVVCNRTANSGDLEDRERVIGQLIAVAASTNAKAPSRRGDVSATQLPAESIADAVLEGCFVLSREQPTQEEAIKMFARALTDLAEAAPAWWPRLRPVVESLVAGLRLDLAHWLTPLLIRARAATPIDRPSRKAAKAEPTQGTSTD